MNPLLRALELAAAGTADISAPELENKEYENFQAIAEALVEAENSKLIYKIAVQRSMAIKTCGHVVRIIISGGLTPKGKEFFDQMKNSSHEISSEPSKKNDPEIFQLRPTFAGMSIDLKVLWKKWQNWKS